MLIHTPKVLSIYLRDRRQKLKLSQTELGKRVGLKQKTISAFENKPENTKLETLFRIISALELDMRLSGKEENNGAKWEHEW